jgi:hypothetical protein
MIAAARHVMSQHTLQMNVAALLSQQPYATNCAAVPQLKLLGCQQFQVEALPQSSKHRLL